MSISIWQYRIVGNFLYTAHYDNIELGEGRGLITEIIEIQKNTEASPIFPNIFEDDCLKTHH